MRRLFCLLITVFLLAAFAVPCLAEDEINIATNLNELLEYIADGKKNITVTNDITLPGPMNFIYKNGPYDFTITFSNATLTIQENSSLSNYITLLFDEGSSLVLEAGAKVTNNTSGTMDFGRNGVLKGDSGSALVNKGEMTINNDNWQFNGTVTQENSSTLLRMGYADSEAALRRLSGQKLSAVSLVSAVTLTEDLILPNGCILFLANTLNGRGSTLTVSDGVTLAIDAGSYVLLPESSKLTVGNSAVLWNEGVIQSYYDVVTYGVLSLQGGTYKGRGTVQVLDDGVGESIREECLKGFDGYTAASLGLSDDFYNFTLLQNGCSAVSPGDVNGDGKRDFADVSLLFRWWNGNAAFTAPVCISDFNGDKAVDLQDAAALYGALS